MSNRAPVLAQTNAARAKVFPKLNAGQMARIAAYGSMRKVQSGEVLVEPGQSNAHFFVVTAGEVEIVRPAEDGDTLIAIYEPGMFSGEVNMISGRRGFVRITATKPSEVIDVDHDRLLALVMTDSELGEILMKTFILRRVEMIAQGLGDIVLLGSNLCASTLRIKEFLMRNGHPYAFIDLEKHDGVQTLLDRFHVSEADMPVVICRGEIVLRNPTNREIADCAGFNETIDNTCAM